VGRRHRARMCALIAILFGFLLPAGATGYTNGQLPASVLSPINTGLSCTELATPAAAGYNTMALAAGKPIPVNGCDSSYRPYDRQVYWRNYWCSRGACGNAAIPGTSNHGWGLAVDVPQWVRGYIDQQGRAYGFDKSCSDAPQEWWHVKFCAPFHRPNPGLSLKYPRLEKGSGGPGQAAYVKKVQRRLRLHGYRQVHTDGNFGPVTNRSVKDFQHAAHLHADGVVGEHTWKLLLKPPRKKHPTQTPGHDQHHASSKPIKGVDVSMHQGSIDWSKVADDNVKLACQKSTEGEDYVDPTFSRDRMENVGRVGIVPCVYHFLRPRADRRGAKEAAFFADQALARGYGKGYLPPVIDIETTTLTAAGTCDYLLSALHRAQKDFGAKPIVYTYPGFASTYLSGCAPLKTYYLWIANYGVSKPTIPAPWGSYLIWQHSDHGSVKGINGAVDLNVLPDGMKKLAKLQVGNLPGRVRNPGKARALAPQAAQPPPFGAVVSQAITGLLKHGAIAEPATDPAHRG